MTISLAQSVLTVPGNWAGNFGSSVAAGDTIFLVATGFNTSNVVISTSSPTFAGNPVTGAAKIMEKSYPFDGTTTDYVAIWMLPNVVGGSTAVGLTMNNSQAISAVGMFGFDVAGLGTTPTVDQAPAPQEALSTAPSSGTSGAITQAPEFVLAVIAQDQTVASLPGAPWTSTQLAAGGNSFSGYQIPTSSGGTYVYSATAAPAARWCAGLVTVYNPSSITPAVHVAVGGGKSMLARSMRWADL